jgi:hypothetical protein
MRLPRGQYIRPKPASRHDDVITDLTANPASPISEVITDSGTDLAEKLPDRSPASSASEPHREAIELGLSRGRNAMASWQDLVDSARRFRCQLSERQALYRKAAWKPVTGGVRRHRNVAP